MKSKNPHQRIRYFKSILFIFICFLSVNAFAQRDFHSVPFDDDIEYFRDSLPDSTFYIDKWGYPMQVLNPSNGVGLRGGGGCGGFTLIFADVILGNGIGFDDAALGLTRQNTACAVFDYIASVIDIGSATPIIYFNPSETDGTGPLGYASSFYPVLPSPGLPIGGFLRDYIVNQLNPLGAGVPHAYINLDFGPRQIPVGSGNFITINSDYLISSNTTGELDLFSIILHEATHALDFASFMDQNGHCSLNPTNTVNGPFSLFDRYFYRTAYELNQTTFVFQGSSADLVSNVLTYNNPGNSMIYSVYSPSIFNSGSSLSHFDDMRDNIRYVMRPSTSGGDDRVYTQGELEVLCNLGYTLINFPWTCNDHFPIGVNETFNGTQGVQGCYQVWNNDQDLDGDPLQIDITIAPPVLVNTSTGTLTFTSNQICYTPDNSFCGTVTIRYRPIDTNHGRPGTFAYLTIVVPCTFCPNDPCNYLCNGDFEFGTSLANFDCCIPNFMDFINPFPLGTSVTSWWSTGGTPDLFIRGSTRPGPFTPNQGIEFNFFDQNYAAGVNTHNGMPNDRYIGGYRSGHNQNFEGAFSQLVQPLTQGDQYDLSLWLFASCLFPSNSTVNGEVNVLISSTPPAPSAVNHTANATTQMLLSNFSFTNSQWVNATNIFTANLPNLQYLIIEPVLPNATNFTQYVFMDDVRIERVGDPLTIVKTVSDPTPQLGQVITYTLQVCNTGGSTLSNVQIYDLLPPGLTYLSGFSAYPNNTIPSIAPGGCVNVLMTATVDMTATTDIPITNCASIVNVTNCIGSAVSCVDIIIETADIQILKTVDNSNPTTGSNVTFTITVSNNGPADATNVIANDLLPANCLTYVSSIVTHGSANYNNGSGNIFIPSILNGDYVELQITATYTGGCMCQNCVNLVSLQQSDLNSSNNSACAALNITQSCLSIDKVVDKTFAYAGQTITYTITISNTSTTAQTVTITDPMSTYFVPTVNSCNLDLNGGSTTLPPIPPGGTTVCTIAGYYTHVGTYTNCVTMEDQNTQLYQSCSDPTDILVGCPMVVCTDAEDCTVGSTVQLCLCLHNLRVGVDHIYFDLIYPNYLSDPDNPNLTLHPSIQPFFASASFGPVLTYSATHDHRTVDIYFTSPVDIGPIPMGTYVNPVCCFDVVIQAQPTTNVDYTWVDGYYTILDPLTVPLSPALTQAGVINYPDPNNLCFPNLVPPDASFSVIQIPCTNTIQVHANLSGPDVINRWEFGDNANTPIFGMDSYSYTYALPGTYTITHTTIQNNVSNTETFTVVIYPPCCTDASYTTIQDGDVSTMYGSGISGGTIEVQGTFVITNYFTINGGAHIIMEPGARIIVQSGGILILDGTLIDACSNMHQGIRLDQGGWLLAYNGAVFKDADKAILANDGSAFYILDCIFDDNIVGIETPANPGGGFNSISYIIVGSQFNHTGVLKPAYTGQDPFGINPKAGIVFQSMAGTIGADWYTENSFDNLNCGIISGASSLSIRNNKFTNIHNEQFYSDDYMGSAIASRGGHGYYVVTVSPFVNQTSGNPTMNYCDYGVYTDFINTGIKSVNMENVNVGVFVERNTHQMTMGMTNCDIQARELGVYLYDNVGSGGMYIGHSRISTDHPKGTCVLAEELTLGLHNLLCEYNIVTSFGSATGIRTINSVSDIIQNNTVNNAYYGVVGWNGISQQGCRKNIITCNNVTGSSSNPMYRSIAIASEVSDQSTISCNATDLTRIGIKFSGVNASTDLRANAMHDHFEGLHLNSNAIIGGQYHKGNMWLGPFNSSFGADNLNSTALGLAASVIHVHTAAAPYNTIIPGYDNGWFQFTPGSPYACISTDCDYFNVHSEIVNDLDRIIAEQLVHTVDFLPESREIAKQYLYKKLKTDIALLQTDADMEDFYNANTNSEIGILQDIKDQIDGFTYYDVSFKSMITSVGNLSESLRDSVEVVDSLLISQGQSPSLESIKINLIAQLKTLETTSHNLIVQRESARSLELSNAIIENNAFNAIGLPESNEKIVNAIYMETVGQDLISFSDAQRNNLSDVAHQCPYAGGRAVFQARALYKLINPNEEYDDESVCLSSGIYRKGKSDQSTIANLALIPNPTKDHVTVSYIPMGDNCLLQVMDLIGNTVIKINLPCDRKEYNLSTTGLATGMYLVKVTSDGNILGTGKLGINR